MNRILIKLSMVVWAFALTTVPVHADELDKIFEPAADLLEKMEAELKGFSRDDNVRDVVDAVGLSKKLPTVLNTIRSENKDNQDVKKRARIWTDSMKDFQGAAINLAKLKNEQNKFGKDRLVPLDCDGWQKDLEDEIKLYLPKHDPDGMAAIPKKARAVAAKSSAALSRAQTTVDAAEDWQGGVNKFRGPYAWGTISNIMTNEAKAMVGDLKNKEKSLISSCKELTKGERHPDVVSARKAIAATTGKELHQLQVLVDDWEERAADYFKTDCEAMKKLADAYCGIDSGDPDGKSEVDRLKSAVSSMIKDVRNENLDLMKEMAKINVALKALSKEEILRGPAKAIYKETEDEIKKLKGLIKSGAMVGFRHPVVQYYLKFGKEMHAKMERSYSCNVRDVAYPGARDRPDCVSAKKCSVFEFKPNNSAAISKGKGQLGQQKPSVEKYYNAVLGGDKISSKFGGQAIMDEFQKSGCIKNNKLKLGAFVKTYNRCENKYQCIR